MTFRALAPLSLIFAAGLTGAAAACPVQPGVTAALPSDAPEWGVMGAALARCGVAVRSDGAPATIIGVDEETYAPMARNFELRPMNDLIKRSGVEIDEARLIKREWRILAIATAVEARHLMYRKDIFDDLGLPAPTSYGEILRVAHLIRAAGVMDKPFAGAFADGEDMADSFVDMYLGMGGVLFLDGFDPSIYNPRGVATLEMLTMLSNYTDGALRDINEAETLRRLQNGEIAMAMLPSKLVGDARAALGARLGVTKAPINGIRPASTVGWSGVSISADASEAEAAAAFAAIIGSLNADMANANPRAANWLIAGHTPPGDAAAPVATARDGALPYPAGPEMAMLKKAIGEGVAPYLKGGVDPSAALLDIELEYKRMAREAGRLN